MKSIIRKVSKSIIPIASIIFTFFGFGVLEMYISNKSEFWFSFSDIAMPIIIWAVAILAGLLVISLLIPDKYLIYYVSILYAISIMLYIQGNFFSNSYGELDGTIIDWGQYIGNFILNGSIWIVVILAVVLLVKRYKKRATYVCKVLCGIIFATQLVTLSILFFNETKNEGSNDGILTTDGKFEISSGENTFVFIVDCFDGILFDELLLKYSPELTNTFENFVFYRDTVGGATRTKYAIPYILTGQIKTEENSYMDYLEEGYRDSILFTELKKGDYDARIFTATSYLDMNRTDIIDNISSEKLIATSSFGLTKDYMKLVAFRYMPDVIKQYFWLYSGDFNAWKSVSGGGDAYVANDVKFYNELVTDQLSCTTTLPVFRFFHLTGTHSPYTMNENCEKISYEDGSEEKQALGTIKLLDEFITQLKELGVYEESTIIIMGDHGLRGLDQNPLLLIKQFESNAPFEISDTPMSYKDIPGILVDALQHNKVNIDEKYVSMGKRYFYVGDSKDMLHEYVTEGLAYDVTSFKETGNVYYGFEKKDSYEYQWGTILSFGKEATANSFCTSGFSKNEGKFTWTSGTSASMKFEIEEAKSNLRLILNYGTTVNVQEVVIYANGYKIADYIADDEEKKELIIPKEYVSGKELELKFEFPNAISPKERGVSGDTRKLSLCMYEMSISETSEAYNEQEQICAYKYQLGTLLSLKKQEATANNYLVRGFSYNENNFTWTNGNISEMKFDISGSYNNLKVQMNCERISANSQHVIIYVNDYEVANYSITNTGKLEFIIPHEYVAEGILKLKMQFPDAISPKERGVGADTRKLAIGISEILVESTDEIYDEDLQKKAYTYELNTEVYFEKENATANPYCINGFSYNEKRFTWTNGTKATMRFCIGEVLSDLEVVFEYAKTITSGQRVIVFANGNEVTNFIADGAETKKFVVSSEYVEGGVITLHIELPDAISPKELGNSNDARTLSLAMKSLRILEAE